MAACSWALDERFQSQRVVAHLLTESGERSAVTFDGQLSRAAAVAYAPGECSLLQDVYTVQRAIDLLCLRGSGSEPGVHVRAVTLASGAELSNDFERRRQGPRRWLQRRLRLRRRGGAGPQPGLRQPGHLLPHP